MSAHTPGPWEHVTDGAGFMSFRGANGEWVVAGCGCCQSPFGHSEDAGSTCYNPTDRDRRNARLIAAAPDLLENLIGCMEALSSHAPDCLEVQCARIAISKALGATP